MAEKGISLKDRQDYKARAEKQIEEIRNKHCACCPEPATGADRCDECEYGQRIGDLYWTLRMMDSEYGS